MPLNAASWTATSVLAAKQAAEADLLTGGKFGLGLGIGWNRVEYEALGQDFSTRGQRLEEQITLLRRLGTEQTVTFSGTFDQITGAGLVPMPIQRPIPVWVGGQSPRAYRRAGPLALRVGTCTSPRKRLVKLCTKRFRGNAEAAPTLSAA